MVVARECDGRICKRERVVGEGYGERERERVLERVN